MAKIKIKFFLVRLHGSQQFKGGKIPSQLQIYHEILKMYRERLNEESVQKNKSY